MEKIFKSKRWIAFFLALLLAVATCINSSDAFLWATGDVVENTETGDYNNYDPVVETREITVYENVEENPQADAEDPEANADVNADINAEDPGIELSLGDPEAGALGISDAEEAEAAQTLVATAKDGAEVTVSAPEGVLPDGAEVTVEEITGSAEEAVDAILIAMQAEGKLLQDLKLYDITVLDKNGEAVQPNGNVSVTIENTGVSGDGSSGFAVYHVQDGGAAKAADLEDADHARFTTDHFSVWGVASYADGGAMLLAETYTYPVYVYIKMDGKINGNEAALEKELADIGLKKNAQDWYTIGKVENVEFKRPIQDSDGDYIYSEISNLDLGNIQWFGDVDRSKLIEWADWKPQIIGRDSFGLHVRSSASDYENEVSGNTWHLDGYVNLSKIPYTVKFADMDTGEVIGGDNFDFQKTGSFGEKVRLSGDYAAPRTVLYEGKEYKLVNGQEPEELTLGLKDNYFTLYYKAESQIRNFDMTKAVSGIATGAEGRYTENDMLTYTITVRNIGNTVLDNFVVKDTMTAVSGGTADIDITERIANQAVAVTDGAGEEVPKATLTWDGQLFTVSEIPVGGSAVISYTYTVQADDAGKTINNTAVAIEKPGEEKKPEQPVIVEGRSLKVKKEVLGSDGVPMSDEQLANAEYKVNDVIGFQVTVTNTGNVTLEDIKLTDTMVGAAGNATVGTGSNTSMIKVLRAGESAVRNFTYTVKEEDLKASEEADGIKNTVRAVASDGTEGYGETNYIRIGERLPEVEKRELSVKKYVANSPANKTGYVMGEEVLFGVTVTNTGNVSQSDIRITDKMQNAAGQAVPVTINAAGETELLDGGHIIERLEAGEDTTVYFSYTVQREDIGKTGIYNEATATSADGTAKTDKTMDIPIDRLYSITIHYVYAASGTAAAPDYTAQFPAGEDYLVYSPVIAEYTSNMAFVTGTMPGRDFEYTVYYLAEATSGGGGGGNGGNGPDTPSAPSAPLVDALSVGPAAMPVLPIPAPAGMIPVVVSALAELADEAVPLQGALIEVDEDGNVTVIPVSEEAIPLAGGIIDEHRCCAMHFMLMLAALVVYLCYAGSMRKYQKKLAKLKDQLAEETLKRQGKI